MSRDFRNAIFFLVDEEYRRYAFDEDRSDEDRSNEEDD